MLNSGSCRWQDRGRISLQVLAALRFDGDVGIVLDSAYIPSQRGLECWYGDRDLLLLRLDRRLSSRLGLFVLS